LEVSKNKERFRKLTSFEETQHEKLKQTVRHNGLAWSIDNLTEDYHKQYLIQNLEKTVKDIETLLRIERSLLE